MHRCRGLSGFIRYDFDKDHAHLLVSGLPDAQKETTTNKTINSTEFKRNNDYRSRRNNKEESALTSNASAHVIYLLITPREVPQQNTAST